MKTFTDLSFSSTYAALGRAFGAAVVADPLPNPRLLDWSAALATELDLSFTDNCLSHLTQVCTGSSLSVGMSPFAALYAGHQFGHYVPQLGDGRAILLGDHQVHGKAWHWQLKGAGVTPYSRRGDGRAVLRSSIREYLVSEAMAGLGIPTTRALALVASDLPVYREQRETGACVLRVSPSFVRFGSFEVFYYRGQFHLLRQLADHVIAEHFSELMGRPNAYVALLEQAVVRTAQLMAKWQSVGFMHGVMNTDNMSILGLTLDYGPFSFMDTYQPDFVSNHSDAEGRYAFSNQPQVGLWNLACLAQSLLPLLSSNEAQAVEIAREVLDGYWPVYQQCYLSLMRKKLGLHRVQDEDARLVQDWLLLLQREQLDYTLSHRQLADWVVCPFVQTTSVAWWEAYQQRLKTDDLDAEQRRQSMNAVNPVYVLRTWMAQAAIDAAQRRDDRLVSELRELLASPFTEQAGMSQYAQPSPDWARGLVLSCSS